VSEARLRKLVAQFARERPPGSAAHAEVRAEAEAALRAQGYAVELHDYGTGVNVVATRAGRRDEAVVLSAHYDHVRGCRGADDNASGVAAVLEVGRALSGGAFDRTLILALWDEEEAGLIGSRAWAKAARARGQAITLALSLDGIGVASPQKGSQRMPPGVRLLVPRVARSMEARGMRGDFIAIVGDGGTEPFIDAFVAAAEPRGLPVEHATLGALKKLAFADAQRSDHASFWLNGYPAALVTDTANYRYAAYHCTYGPDDPDRLSYPFLAQVTASLAEATAKVLSD
jgi:Zn-dependent M28 family amino/carboxypeptidase